MNQDYIQDASEFVNDANDAVIIKAVGVGGGGNNAVDHMYRQGIRNVSFVNINTDRQALNRSKVPNLLQLGPGLGAGNKPEVAQAYAEEAEDRINAIFDDDTRMVFITAGMGGGTGTGAAPVVARIARSRGLLTVGIITIPFLFEGKPKIRKALQGADEMAKYVDALLVINNERLTEIYGDYSLVNAFEKADDTLSIAARSISELITCEGHMNLDFNDVDTTLRCGGAAIISTGFGEGENRVTKAIHDALDSPLLRDRDIMHSKRLLFNLVFSPEAENAVKTDEVRELNDFIGGIEDVDVIWGIGYDKSLGDTVKITILAAGFDLSVQDEANEISSHSSPFGLPLGGKRGGSSPVPQKKEQKPVSKIDESRLRKEYGTAVDMFDEVRRGYIILEKGQMDDDAIIETLERCPTYKRDRKIVENIRSKHIQTARPDSPNSSREITFN